MEQGLSTLWLAITESWLAPIALSGLAPTLFFFHFVSSSTCTQQHFSNTTARSTPL